MWFSICFFTTALAPYSNNAPEYFTSENVYTCELNELDALIVNIGKEHVTFTDFLFYVDMDVKTFNFENSRAEIIFDWFLEVDKNLNYYKLNLSEEDLTASYEIIDGKTNQIISAQKLVCTLFSQS